MRLTITTVLFGISVATFAPAQEMTPAELASMLADRDMRQVAVDRLSSSSKDDRTLLLSWTQNPPRNVDREGLFIGMADAFRQLSMQEAIPFLIKYIALERSSMRPNIWLKTDEAIEGQLPAVGALIRLGLPASRALLEVDWYQRPPGDRLAAIFALAKIGDPAARTFLASALGHANLELQYAQQGLRRLDGH